ncbi:MAG: NAD(P)-binding domain-containing protein, partial [Bacteroidota bacterium]
MDDTSHSIDEYYDVVIVGAGPAGLGVGILLQKLGIDYVILEKDFVGSSFRKWPEETRFISPSFTGNFFNMPDLNAISPDTSPAFNLSTEHPSGIEYARYLEGIAKHFKLTIQPGIHVKSVKKENSLFSLETDQGKYKSTYLIWAAGEYQYPKRKSFEGAELCVHFSDVQSFS